MPGIAARIALAAGDASLVRAVRPQIAALPVRPQSDVTGQRRPRISPLVDERLSSEVGIAVGLGVVASEQGRSGEDEATFGQVHLHARHLQLVDGRLRKPSGLAHQTYGEQDLALVHSGVRADSAEAPVLGYGKVGVEQGGGNIAPQTSDETEVVAHVCDGDFQPQFAVAVHGPLSAVVVALDDLDSLEATIEILSDAGRLASLVASESEIAKGQVVSGKDLVDVTASSAARYLVTRPLTGEGGHLLFTSPTVRRQLTEQLPEATAFAALELITGPLLGDPSRVGRRLRPPLDDRWSTRRGTYRSSTGSTTRQAPSPCSRSHTTGTAPPPCTTTTDPGRQTGSSSGPGWRGGSGGSDVELERDHVGATRSVTPRVDRLC